jgi:hypothetical protein
MAIKPQQASELQRVYLFWIYTRVCGFLQIIIVLKMSSFLPFRYDSFKGAALQQTPIQPADGSMLSSGNFQSDVSCIQPPVLQQNEYQHVGCLSLILKFTIFFLLILFFL